MYMFILSILVHQKVNIYAEVSENGPWNVYRPGVHCQLNWVLVAIINVLLSLEYNSLVFMNTVSNLYIFNKSNVHSI